MNSSKFISFCKKNNIGHPVKHGDRYTVGFTKEDSRKLFSKPNFINASTGGLILGNSHKEGGIFIIYQAFNMGKETVFFFGGEMEGNEYIVNPKVFSKHKTEIESINKSVYPSDGYEKICFEENFKCRIIDVQKIDLPIIYIEHNTFIVNSFATKKHIHRLIELDK